MQGGVRNLQDSKSALRSVHEVGVRVPRGTPLEVVDANTMKHARERGEVLLTPPNSTSQPSTDSSQLLVADADTTADLDEAALHLRESANGAAAHNTNSVTGQVTGAVAGAQTATDNFHGGSRVFSGGVNTDTPLTRQVVQQHGAGTDFAGGQTGLTSEIAVGLVDREFKAAFGGKYVLMPQSQTQRSVRVGVAI